MLVFECGVHRVDVYSLLDYFFILKGVSVVGFGSSGSLYFIIS